MNEDTCNNLGKCEFICIHDNIGLIIDCSPGIPRQWGRNRHKPCDRGGHWEDISLIRKPSTEGILHDIIIWCITSPLLAVKCCQFFNEFFWGGAFFMANTWFFLIFQKKEVCNYNSSKTQSLHCCHFFYFNNWEILLNIRDNFSSKKTTLISFHNYCIFLFSCSEIVAWVSFKTRCRMINVILFFFV